MLTISPITEVLPVSGNDSDLIVLSGYTLRSYITFVKEHLPYDSMKLQEMPGISKVFTVRDRKLPNSPDLFVIISTEASTLVLIPVKPGQFEEAEASKNDFEFCEKTLACLSVGITTP